MGLKKQAENNFTGISAVFIYKNSTDTRQKVKGLAIEGQLIKIVMEAHKVK